MWKCGWELFYPEFIPRMLSIKSEHQESQHMDSPTLFHDAGVGWTGEPSWNLQLSSQAPFTLLTSFSFFSMRSCSFSQAASSTSLNSSQTM